MARILTIFGRNRSSRRNPSFQKFSNERKLSNRSNQLIRSVDRSIVLIDGRLACEGRPKANGQVLESCSTTTAIPCTSDSRTAVVWCHTKKLKKHPNQTFLENFADRKVWENFGQWGINKKVWVFRVCSLIFFIMGGMAPPIMKK